MKRALVFIKSILIRLFGIKKYLKIISRTYFLLEKLNLLKFFGHELYDVFHLNKFVHEGAICIDIGANLGYYSIPLSRLCGKNGKVLAVEPVQIFVEVLKSNLSKFGCNNVSVYDFALGEKEGQHLTMGTPVIDGIFRHGFTKVLQNDGLEYADRYEVSVKNPNSIFGDLEKIDFIKCDVEGYEHHIIPLIYNLINKYKPVLLIEFGSTENKRDISKHLIGLGYKVYSVSRTVINEVENPGESASETFNFFFIPENKVTFVQ